VLLILDEDERPVEFGAIKINLDLFGSAPCKLIRENRLPLGQILKDFSISHTSRPKAYLKLKSDEFINQALNVSGSQTLYGRRNTLSDLRQRPLAEVVEILPLECTHAEPKGSGKD